MTMILRQDLRHRDLLDRRAAASQRGLEAAGMGARLAPVITIGLLRPFLQSHPSLLHLRHQVHSRLKGTEERDELGLRGLLKVLQGCRVLPIRSDVASLIAQLKLVLRVVDVVVHAPVLVESIPLLELQLPQPTPLELLLIPETRILLLSSELVVGEAMWHFLVLVLVLPLGLHPVVLGSLEGLWSSIRVISMTLTIGRAHRNRGRRIADSCRHRSCADMNLSGRVNHGDIWTSKW
mmetsp:Transcript_32320/g.57958  ORF Transcript_32320/g.57958 Transcript_32320/m.57958 type:complete len:236 (+) Transcript_32320:158-865(+)